LQADGAFTLIEPLTLTFHSENATGAIGACLVFNVERPARMIVQRYLGAIPE